MDDEYPPKRFYYSIQPNGHATFYSEATPEQLAKVQEVADWFSQKRAIETPIIMTEERKAAFGQIFLDTVHNYAQTLLSETHPHVCTLRDQNYPELEALVLRTIEAVDTPISIQTALAVIEEELSEADK